MSAARFLVMTLSVFFALSALYIGAFFALWSQPTSALDPLRDLHVVKARIAAETPSPRWLIVGGSSAWFGFDSELLMAALEQPVVNLGNHAEVPLWFQLREVERHARTGDTVLLAMELVHYWRVRSTTYGVSKLGVLEPELFARARLEEKWDLLRALPPSHVVARLIARVASDGRLAAPSVDELMANLRRRRNGSYAGEVPGYYNYLELDRYGGFARIRHAAAHAFDDYGLNKSQEIPGRVARELAASARRLSDRGVRCVFVWPPLEQRAELDLGSAVARANLDEIRRRLTSAGWREIGTVDDAILASEFFYDTAFHLTSEGARRRTLRFIGHARESGVIGPTR